MESSLCCFLCTSLSINVWLLRNWSVHGQKRAKMIRAFKKGSLCLVFCLSMVESDACRYAHHLVFRSLLLRDALASCVVGLACILFVSASTFSRVYSRCSALHVAFLQHVCASPGCILHTYMWHSHAACASSVPFFRTRLFGQFVSRMIVKPVADQDERIERLLRE